MGKREAALRLVGVGFFIGLSILGGVLLGLWVDDKFNTRPIFMILGLFGGLAVAGYGVYTMLLPLLKNKNGE